MLILNNLKCERVWKYHISVMVLRWRAVMYTCTYKWLTCDFLTFLWRAYGKPGNLDPEPESGTGTGTGTGEINEWFKLGSMIDINTPPPLSAFLARWMTIRWNWVWDGALIIQNIFDFVCRSRQYWAIAWNVSSTCENLSLLWVLLNRATK